MDLYNEEREALCVHGDRQDCSEPTRDLRTLARGGDEGEMIFETLVECERCGARWVERSSTDPYAVPDRE